MGKALSGKLSCPCDRSCSKNKMKPCQQEDKVFNVGFYILGIMSIYFNTNHSRLGSGILLGA